ncbi:hypothetical protein ACUH7Y_00850 [Clostridium beijerinckii]|uniref:Uncharacterized protein n=1 Tax=Clostridium beijerinckii TaxID=1520 RepID=A0A7X9SRR3_CLOBE|nr:hypothetical protein [Clostridium beijerinckii]NMF06877.1 hypothetical protein [Clostridium beijerinckii]
MSQESINYQKKLHELNEFAEDGIYTVSNSSNEPKIKIRDLVEYCENNNIQSNELRQEEYTNFIIP